jgi:phage terminase small subunit
VEHDLNARQLRFAVAILEGKTQREAYDHAGYTAKDRDAAASAIASNPKVAAFIEQHKGRAANNALVTRERVVTGLLGIAEGDGADAPRVRAWELLGKDLGMFTERHDVNVTGDIVLDLVDAPDASYRDAE